MVVFRDLLLFFQGETAGSDTTILLHHSSPYNQFITGRTIPALDRLWIADGAVTPMTSIEHTCKNE